MKKETPLQKLIAEYDSALNYFESVYEDEVLESTKDRLKIRISQLKHDRRKVVNLLPYEREIIIDTRVDIGHYKGISFSDAVKESEQYFEQTFKTDNQ